MQSPAGVFNDVTPHHRYFSQYDLDGIRDIKTLRPIYVLDRKAIIPRVKPRPARKQKRAKKPKLVMERPLILPEILNLQRLPETAPIDGCARIHKGHTESGGFFAFTCEKLKPKINISNHEVLARRYRVLLKKAGWKSIETEKPKSTKHTRKDKRGCRISVEITVWDDRAMGEPVLNREDRNSFRQIIFLTSFDGKKCEPYYDIVETLSLAKYR